MNLKALGALPLALQRRVVRGAAESLGLRLEFRQVEEILETASLPPGASERRRGQSMLLPRRWRVSRRKGELHFELQGVGDEVSDYHYPLPVPGSVAIPELGSRFEIKLIGRNAVQGYNPQHLFDPELLADELAVRNWRPGDRFWPAHAKAPKKVKELLQDRQVTGPERRLWPVVVSGVELVWLRGFPAPARWQPPKNAHRALLLQELAWLDRSSVCPEQ
jgi:tRNA(Ile)-lysidine synthase